MQLMAAVNVTAADGQELMSRPHFATAEIRFETCADSKHAAVTSRRAGRCGRGGPAEAPGTAPTNPWSS